MAWLHLYTQNIASLADKIMPSPPTHHSLSCAIFLFLLTTFFATLAQDLAVMNDVLATAHEGCAVVVCPGTDADLCCLALQAVAQKAAGEGIMLLARADPLRSALRHAHEGAGVDPAYRDVSIKYAPEGLDWSTLATLEFLEPVADSTSPSFGLLVAAGVLHGERVEAAVALLRAAASAKGVGLLIVDRPALRGYAGLVAGGVWEGIIGAGSSTMMHPHLRRLI